MKVFRLFLKMIFNFNKTLYAEYEDVDSVDKLTAKQRAQLLRISCNERSFQLLGPNGKKLAEQVYKRFINESK